MVSASSAATALHCGWSWPCSTSTVSLYWFCLHSFYSHLKSLKPDSFHSVHGRRRPCLFFFASQWLVFVMIILLWTSFLRIIDRNLLHTHCYAIEWGACKVRRKIYLHFATSLSVTPADYYVALALPASYSSPADNNLLFGCGEEHKKEKKSFLHYDIKACSLYCRRL